MKRGRIVENAYPGCHSRPGFMRDHIASLGRIVRGEAFVTQTGELHAPMPRPWGET